MRVTFSPELQRYTSGLAQIEVKALLLRDAVVETLSRFPQLAVFLMGNAGEESKKTSLRLNDQKYLYASEDLLLEVGDADVLAFGRDIPGGEKGGIFQIIAGAIMVVTGVWTGNGALVGTGIGMMVGGIGAMIMGTPKLAYGDGSPTYSFDGIQNTTVSGTPLGLVYGRHRVGGHHLNVYTDLEGKNTHYLYAQIGLCEGPVADVYDVQINGKRLSSYAKNTVETAFTRGTADQKALPWFNRVENTVSVNQKITNDGMVVELQEACTKVKLCVSAPALFRMNDKGKMRSAEVVYTVDYRLSGSTEEWQRVTPGSFALTGSSKSEVAREDTIDLPGHGVYDLRVRRVTSSRDSDIKYTDVIYVKSVTRLTYDEFAYPHTAVLGVKARATDQISGQMPTITSMVKGREVRLPNGYDGEKRLWAAPWDGTLAAVKSWTDNPAWCLYDLLTDKRAGLGRYLNLEPASHGLLLAQFVLMANYCDTLLATGETYTGTYYAAQGWSRAHIVVTSTPDVSSIGVGQAVSPEDTEALAKIILVQDNTLHLAEELPLENGASVTFGTREPRFSLNVVLDSQQQALEAVNQLLGVMRASAFYADSRLQIDIDRPKPISHLFAMSNVVEGSFSRASASQRETPNVLEVQFPNSATNYEVDSFRVESVALRDDHFLEERVKSLQLKGVTSYAHALRLARYILYTGQFEGSTVAFRVSTDGFGCMVGDVVGLQHDVPQWGFGGRVAGMSGATVTLTQPVELDLTCQYVMRLNHKVLDEATGTLVPVTIPVLFDTAGAQNNRVSVSAVTLQGALPDGVTLAPGDVYVLGETSYAVKPFRILALRRLEDETVEITATDYREDLYELCDSTAGGGLLVETNYSRLPDPRSTTVTDVKVSERTYVDAVGNLVIGLDVSYSVPTTNAFWDGAVILYGEAGTGVFDALPVNRTGYAYIAGLTPGYAYDVVVLSQFRDGTRQTVEEVLALVGETPSVTVEVGGLPTAYALPTPRGLELYGQGLNLIFVTPDARFVWKSTSLDGTVDLGSSDYEAGQGFLSSLFKDYRVEVWADNRLRRLAYTTIPEYSYPFTANCDDGNGTPARTFMLKVWVRDKYNRQSETPAMLTVTNLQLPAVANLLAVPAVGGCVLRWDETEAADLAGYRVYGSTSGTEFVPGEESLRSVTKATQATFTDLEPGSTWHFKVAAVDTFGPHDLQFATVTYEVPYSNALDTEPPAVPTGLQVVREQVIGSSSTLAASWQANTEGDLSHYLVRFRRAGGAESVTYPAYEASMAVAGMVTQFAYLVAVRAVDKWGNASDWCAEVEVVGEVDETPPGAPTNLRATVGFMSVFLAWENPTDDDLSHVELWAGTVNDRDQAELLADSLTGNSHTDVLESSGQARYYWARAVDTSGNVSEWSNAGTEGVEAVAGKVQTADIETFAVDASKIYVQIPIVTGDAWQDRAGDENTVGWNAHTLTYNGSQYAITAGSTAHKYVYWLQGESQYRSSDANPTLGDDDFLIATNVEGYHDLAWNAIANQVVGSAHIQHAAICDLHVESLHGDKIRAATLHGDRIITDTLDAKAIKAGTLTADKVVSFGAGVSLDGFIEPNVNHAGTATPGEFGVGTWADDGSRLRGTPPVKVTLSGTEYTTTGGRVLTDAVAGKATMLLFTTAPERFAAIGQTFSNTSSHLFAVYQQDGQWWVDDGFVGEGLGGIPFTLNTTTDFIVGTFRIETGSVVGWQPALTAQTTISGNRITTGVIDAGLVRIVGTNGSTLIGDGSLVITGGDLAGEGKVFAELPQSGATVGMTDAEKTTYATLAEAQADATAKANAAELAAKAYADAEAALAETTAKAYADGIVSDEEARAIADAQAKADAAQAAAIAAAEAEVTARGLADSGNFTGSVDGTAASTVVAQAADPVAQANTKSTRLLPGLVEVKGGSGVTLADWVAAGGEGTLIDGGQIFTGSIAADSLNIGLQPNLVRNGYDCFDMLPAGTVLPAATSVESAVVTAAKSYSGRHALAVRTLNTMTTPWVWLGAAPYADIPLVGGQRYLVSAYVLADSAAAVDLTLGLRVVDGTGTLLAHLALPTVTKTSADGWFRVAGAVTVPAGGVGGVVAVSVPTVGATVYFDCLQLEQASGNVTAPGPWKPGGTTSIDGGLITAESIVGSQIKAGEITASHLAAGSVTAEKLTSGELITSSAQIKDGIIDFAKITGDIQSDNFSPTAGWKLDKSGPAAGHAEFHSMTVRNGNGDIILDSGSGVAWDAVYGQTGLAAVDRITPSNVAECMEPGVMTSTYIADAAVGTLKIQENAVTVPVGAYTAGNIALGTSWVTIQQATINALGQPVSIDYASAYFITWSANWHVTGELYCRLVYSTGTEIIPEYMVERHFGSQIVTLRGTVSFSTMIFPAGSVTVYLQLRLNTTSGLTRTNNAFHRYLGLIGMKR